MMTQAHDSICDIIQTLKDQGHYDNIIIIVASDVSSTGHYDNTIIIVASDVSSTGHYNNTIIIVASDIVIQAIITIQSSS